MGLQWRSPATDSSLFLHPPPPLSHTSLGVKFTCPPRSCHPKKPPPSSPSSFPAKLCLLVGATLGPIALSQLWLSAVLWGTGPMSKSLPSCYPRPSSLPKTELQQADYTSCPWQAVAAWGRADGRYRGVDMLPQSPPHPPATQSLRGDISTGKRRDVLQVSGH